MIGRRAAAAVVIVDQMRWIAPLVMVALAAAPAHADYADDAAIGLQIAKGGFDRFRRSIAIGPHAGGIVGFDTDGNNANGFTVGFGVYTFDIKVFDLQRMVAEAIRERVKERVKEIIASGGTAPADLSELARQVAADVKAELLGEKTKQRTLEKPQWKVILEYLHFVNANGARAQISKGVKSLSFGLGLGGLRGGGESIIIVGAEMSLHLTPIGRSRTPVIDLFLRADLPLKGPNSELILLGGGRLLLDVL